MLVLKFYFYNLILGAGTDQARKHGMEEFIAADPITFDHHNLFGQLQKLSLDWRLKDPYASLVRLSFSSTKLGCYTLDSRQTFSY